jgi:hypothetical protein
MNRRAFLRPIATLAGRGTKQPARSILTLDGFGELRRDLSKLGIRSANSTDASALADSIELGDGFVKALPHLLRPAAAGSGLLQLERWRGTARRRWPLESILVGSLARGSALRGGRKIRQPSAGSQGLVARGRVREAQLATIPAPPGRPALSRASRSE